MGKHPLPVIIVLSASASCCTEASCEPASIYVPINASVVQLGTRSVHAMFVSYSSSIQDDLSVLICPGNYKGRSQLYLS